MNADPVLLRGIPVKAGMALFLGILVLLWLAATVWCAVSCLKEGARWLWNHCGRLMRRFQRQKEGET